MLWLGMAISGFVAVMMLREVWGSHQRISLPRTFTVPLLVLSLIATGGLTWWQFSAWSNERMVSRLVARISQQADARAQCASASSGAMDIDSAAGYVKSSPDGQQSKIAYLDYKVCESIRRTVRLLPQGVAALDQLTDRDIFAFQVVAHEAIHLTGVSDEVTTDCMALQRNYTLTQLLGASAQQSAKLAGRLYEYYQRTGGSAYQPLSVCGPGLSGDENLPNAPWDFAPDGAPIVPAKAQ